MNKWTPPRNSGGIPKVSTRFSLSMEMSRLTRGTGLPNPWRDQILRHERGKGNIHFSCSVDHVQDWQPYPVDPFSCYMCDHTYIHTSSNRVVIIYCFIGCKDKTSTWYLNGFPDGNNLGSTVY